MLPLLNGIIHTLFIHYEFHMWVDSIPGFAILSHSYCQYKNILIMAALLYTLISDMPSPLLITLLSHGIPGCSFFVCSSKQHISILFIFGEKT